jgi:N-acetylglucosaminyldiphosphoundecaprenol N-acetyl-beta-D-mannosaminyltransferase
MEKIKILDCPCLAVNNEEEIKDYIFDLVQNEKGGYSVAINAEKVVLYNKNNVVKNLIEDSILPTIDGGGITVGLKILERKTFPRIDLPKSILELAHEKSLRLFILGAEENINNTAVENIKKKFPQINMVGNHHGFFKDINSIIELLDKSKPQIVFIAMGSPKQEFLAVDLFKTFNKTIFVGCGGAIDVFAGIAKRPPSVIGDNHLEWLYRLIKKPSRIRRQKALFVFGGLVLKSYFRYKV